MPNNKTKLEIYNIPKLNTTNINHKSRKTSILEMFVST